VQVNEAKNQLGDLKEKLPQLVEDVVALEEQITKISNIAKEGEKLQWESIRLQNLKDENLTAFEKQLVEKISSTPHGVSISQLRQLVSESDDIWEQVRNLYRKGYLEIIVNPRE
jgi:regulator of replication initiation timing